MLRYRLAALGALAGMVLSSWPAAAQQQTSGQHMVSVWDLPLGAHARELPLADYIDYACGTNGGPPSQPVNGWMDFAKCQAEADTGLHEIYFRYDDELEYRGRARNMDLQIQRFQYTAVNDIPVIASALFDADGFYVGLRLVTDPRVDISLREMGMTLTGYLFARFGDDEWSCTDLPKVAGESAFQGVFIKRQCTKQGEVDSLGGHLIDLSVETHNLRRRGQTAINQWDNIPTEGEFESSTRLEAVLANPLADKQQRLAEIEALGPLPVDPDLERARDCAGCDLAGVNLKRANLAGANLAGANLVGANLHGANLDGANLAGADLSGANLNRVTARRANFEGAKLEKAMLFDSQLDGANLIGAAMSEALAGSVRLAGANLTDADMQAVDLRNSRLIGADFIGANLTGSWMHNAEISRADFTGATLIYVVAYHANLVAANLTEVDARGADFFGSVFRDADLSNADFSYTRLASANLWSTTLTGTQFIEAELPAGFRVPDAE